MKQTATDYLYEQVLDLFIQYTEDKINSVRFAVLMERAKDKAKEINKDEITEAYKHGQNNGYMYGMQNANIIDSEQYYNQTYNS
jgi:hypothetical protein